MSALFINIPLTFWSKLRDTLGSLLQSIILNPSELRLFLLEMQSDQRYHFLTHISGFDCDTAITPELIALLFEIVEKFSFERIIS